MQMQKADVNYGAIITNKAGDISQLKMDKVTKNRFAYFDKKNCQLI